MSTESSDGSTTQGPGLKWQEDTVNGSASTSVLSDWRELCHQGSFTPNFEFGGEIIKTKVRADKKRTDRDRHTSQRVQNRPLDLLTWNVPPTGEMDNLRGPTCSQNGYLCNNDLETCKRTIKGGKGQLNTNGIKDLPCPVEMDSNKSCNIDYSNAKAAMESGELNPMAQHGTTIGLTIDCNTIEMDDPPTPPTTNTHTTTVRNSSSDELRWKRKKWRCIH